jgi:hypothetical protein
MVNGDVPISLEILGLLLKLGLLEKVDGLIGDVVVGGGGCR